MTITLNIPNEAEQTLRQAWGEQLDQATLEALIIDGYRTGKFGTGTVRQLLGLESRWDAEDWLASRGLCRNYSLEDLEADRKTLARARRGCVMLVVADTSPLSALAELGDVDILPTLFGQVLIPPQVAAELSHPRAPLAARQLIAVLPPWLQIRQPSMIQAIRSLNPGEEAAISLARECTADLLLIDEKSGRRAAISLGLSIIGTVGVLERAANAGLIDLQDAFRRLRMTRFAVADLVLDAALKRHEEKRGGRI